MNEMHEAKFEMEFLGESSDGKKLDMCGLECQNGPRG